MMLVSRTNDVITVTGRAIAEERELFIKSTSKVGFETGPSGEVFLRKGMVIIFVWHNC